eukprot:5540998-Pleurochrysis_carterae.AAC.1
MSGRLDRGELRWTGRMQPFDYLPVVQTARDAAGGGASAQLLPQGGVVGARLRGPRADLSTLTGLTGHAG